MRYSLFLISRNSKLFFFPKKRNITFFKPFITSSTLLKSVIIRENVIKHVQNYVSWVKTYFTSIEEKLNELTGYTKIEKLKCLISEQEINLKKARIETKEAKYKHTLAIQERLKLQQEVNELLQRKHLWTPSDLERFTSLYRYDHVNEQEEQKAYAHLIECESKLDELQVQLIHFMLRRYHEEQIWSDKIRRMSTWGTWSLIGFNIMLFLIIQLGLEPRKRKKLINDLKQHFELLSEKNQIKYDIKETEIQDFKNLENTYTPLSVELNKSKEKMALHYFYDVKNIFYGEPIEPKTVSILCISTAFLGATLCYLIQQFL
ncbi:hypothetical protein T552_00542 [Pneumocystis carinii B80]|uniref:Sensitive to high expression protein 9, mitochondrial n=1 Tax=Pneumocystis carinii (strain B80) TaxID=1408658 RepID=A0A0W4ZR45_PNEC8|nr:hypothetical protein T552_00542 [Pneumocystis carinii B80]KTW30830.1 hypothetical protein T552_00542 [Pneumocystis carinii B80]